MTDQIPRSPGSPVFRAPVSGQPSAPRPASTGAATPASPSTPPVASAAPTAPTAGEAKPRPGPTSSFLHEIDVLVRAKYPILYLVTHEEERAEKIICDVARLQNKRCYSWSYTRGLLEAGTDLQMKKKISEATTDPFEAMNAVIDNVENAIFIFKDLHPFLKDPRIVRRLRELAAFLRDSPRTLFLVSPSLVIPCELEKEITVIEFGFPTPEEINQKIDEMIELVRNNPRVKINLPQPDRERLIKACSGLTLREIENVLSKTLISQLKLDGEDFRAILEEKEQIIRKSGILEFYAATEAFKNVGGLENLKAWLEKRRLAFSEKARAFGCTPPKGIMLLGVQGCGKSLVAKAVSSLWNVPLLRLDMGRIFSSLVGSSEENVRRAIRTAESVAPAILWVDEVEKAFAGVQSSGAADSGVTSRVFGTFLTWLQEKTSPVFVIATSNKIRDLPPELFRKGRFDDIFFVDLPLPAERKAIFAIHLQKKGRDPQTFDLERLASASEGYSGAEIEEAIGSAIYEAFALDQPLSTDLILKALSETYPLSKTMKEEIDDLRRWASERARPASALPMAQEPFKTHRALEIG